MTRTELHGIPIVTKRLLIVYSFFPHLSRVFRKEKNDSIRNRFWIAYARTGARKRSTAANRIRMPPKTINTTGNIRSLVE